MEQSPLKRRGLPSLNRMLLVQLLELAVLEPFGERTPFGRSEGKNGAIGIFGIAYEEQSIGSLSLVAGQKLSIHGGYLDAARAVAAAPALVPLDARKVHGGTWAFYVVADSSFAR